ncbi:hypothetical protein EJ05DRAFT_529031, partial [Pseudovirgaria hyperparasitica]
MFFQMLFLWLGSLAISGYFMLRFKYPSVKVPACPDTCKLEYKTSVGSEAAFPLTKVDLCYDASSVNLKFTAHNETNYFFNSSYGTNDPINRYEVMGALIRNEHYDIRRYRKFEVAPNNVTSQAFNVADEHDVEKHTTTYITGAQRDGLISTTTLNQQEKTWVSDVKIPLPLLEVKDGEGKGTKWRMNFFRTVVGEKTFPKQEFGTWSRSRGASDTYVLSSSGKVKFV